MLLRRNVFCLLLLIMCSASRICSASTIILDFSFRVDAISYDLVDGVLDSNVIEPPVIGDIYHAIIGVDKSILSFDGIIAGKVLSFDAHIGRNQWNPALPPGDDYFFGNVFQGFRGPCVPSYGGCMYSRGVEQYLGFHVLNGHVVGLNGGVYGYFDFPFIDFEDTVYRSDSFFKSNKAPNFDPITVHTVGALSVREVSSVPEPSSTLLLVAGALALLLFRRNRDFFLRFAAAGQAGTKG